MELPENAGVALALAPSVAQMILKLRDGSWKLRTIMIEPSSDPSCRNKPARSLWQRIDGAVAMLQFGWVRGGSLTHGTRLFHYLAFKPSLVIRGWGSYSPERIVSFSIKATGNARFRTYVHDNGLEAGTIAEFFSPHSRIVPVELPPSQEPTALWGDLG